MAKTGTIAADVSGDPDGLEFSHPTIQWRLTAAGAVLVLYHLIGRSLDAPSGASSLLRSLLRFLLPTTTGCVSLALIVSLPGKAPSRSIVNLIVLHAMLLITFVSLGAALPFVVGSCTGATCWFYYVVLLMVDNAGQGNADAYAWYTLLAPTAIASWNALGYLFESRCAVVLLGVCVSGCRWPFAAILGSAVQLYAGKAFRLYSFTPVQHVGYAVGLAGLYVFVMLGVCCWLEDCIMSWVSSEMVRQSKLG
mmetsp:Transcript_82445/g.229775  ORF Transcript_82445/g.229775 Transcript_82445/m.229775 type:complete len:251 (+) Transcript_82445:124-876(+)